MFTFAVDYFILVFVASLGVMQAGASLGGLRGLLAFKNPVIARLLGVLMPVGALVWFFVVEERNINDYEGGLDSNEQAVLFFLAVAASGIFTCVLTSLVNARMAGDEVEPYAGLGALRGSSWFRELARNYGYWRCWFGEGRCWRTQIKRYFFG